MSTIPAPTIDPVLAGTARALLEQARPHVEALVRICAEVAPIRAAFDAGAGELNDAHRDDDSLAEDRALDAFAVDLGYGPLDDLLYRAFSAVKEATGCQ